MLSAIQTQELNLKLDIKQLLFEVWKEIRSLRAEINFVLPQENLEEYANAERIKNSYQNAIKRYPPMAKIC